MTRCVECHRVARSVRDLAQGMEAYRRLGFNVQPGGVHPGKGTHNAIMLNDPDYVELLAIHDPAEDRAAEESAGRFRRNRAEFIAAGGGIRYAVLQGDDLVADVAAMRGRGVQLRRLILRALKTGIRASSRVACVSGSALPVRL